MDEIKSIVAEYFAEHPINVEQVIADYEKKYKTKIIDDTTGKTFKLGANESKLYMMEKQILIQEVI